MPSAPCAPGWRSSRRCAKLETPPARRCRCGSASRPGWSSSATSSARATRRSAAIVGETPNLAARLQGDRRAGQRSSSPKARAGFSAISSSSRTSARKDLKGIAGPVRAWAALRASRRRAASRRCTRAASPRWSGARRNSSCCCGAGRGRRTAKARSCCSPAKPGIGKSRLTAALLERLAGEPHTRLRYFCSPQHTDSALYPIIGQMERAAGLAHDDAPQATARQARRVAGADLDAPAEDAALFAEMLSLPNDGRYPALELDPAAAPAKNAGGAHRHRWRRWRGKIRC